ncbi:hypothetical protein HZY83_03820 [Gemella sp. GH3]|uniref:hypothetical protein n=1 Tax=unclassified Gemella TaxID=2624949 RepID=UPI0015D0548A|nr:MULTISPECIES: hypothetical protein [unclassified Gemella]MBF0713808.1 hypothetical protein [Gemella sp. GH3.1]NYS50760.1 hypothetical protein [Gemella sp. GH3]
MLKIEFLKIFKRKYNYVYFLISSIILLGLAHNYEKISNYLDVTTVDFLYSYLYKVVLIFSMIIVVVNLVRSYREDYYTGVYRLLNKANVSYFNILVSKVQANILVFLFSMFAKILILSSYLHFIKGIGVRTFLNEKYFILILIMLLFTIFVTLFIVSIFNDTNIALSLTLLFFLGNKFLVIYLSKISEFFVNIEYTFLGVYSKSFTLLENNITNRNFYELVISLSINCLILLILSLLVKFIKKK